MKQTKLFVVVVFALAVLFATSAFAAQLDLTGKSRLQIINLIMNNEAYEFLSEGYNVSGDIKPDLSFVVVEPMTSLIYWDGTQTQTRNTGDTVDTNDVPSFNGKRLVSVWFNTNTDPADDTDLVFVDISEMNRLETIEAIFAKVVNASIEGGYGVSGDLKPNIEFTVSGVMTGFQDGTNYGPGQKVSSHGQSGTAWFSINTDEEDSGPEITEIDISKMKTSEDIINAVKKDVISRDIGNGGAVITIKENISFVVSGDVLTEVQDGENHTAGATVYGRGQRATLWFKVHTPESGPDNGGSNPGEGENGEGNNPEPQTFTADQLISAGDLKKYFDVISEGANGEIQVWIPAYTTITVHEAWDFAHTGSGKKYAGESFTTGDSKEQVTWWPNVAYWEAKNSVQLTSANLSTFLSTTGDTWKTATLTSAAEGKKLRVASDSDLALLTRKDGTVTEPDFVNSETKDEIIVAEKSDIDNSNGQLFNSTDNLEKASPAPIKITVQSDGKVEVVFFAGVNKLHLVGTNIFKYSYDENRCTLEGNVLTTSDGYVIGTMTIYLNSRGNSNGGTNGSVSGSGGGGGGCNSMNYSALLFAVIPFALRKRS